MYNGYSIINTNGWDKTNNMNVWKAKQFEMINRGWQYMYFMTWYALYKSKNKQSAMCTVWRVYLVFMKIQLMILYKL